LERKILVYSIYGHLEYITIINITFGIFYCNLVL
jgi:hypothetical protein